MNLQKYITLATGVTEHAVQFKTGSQSVVGNLITCDSHTGQGVLFIHGFGGMRSGPHNLLTHLARQLADNGIPSIRYDLSGRGESSGSPQDVTLAGMAEDALSAVKVLKSEARVTKVTIVGICSGGNVGIGILDRLSECNGLFLLSVYPFGDADSFQRDARRSAAMLKLYWKKLWIRDTWMKLIRGDIQFGIIAGIVLKPLKRLMKRSEKKEAQPKEEKKTQPLDNLLINTPKLTMIYGDADPEFGLSTEYYTAFSKEKGYPIDLQVLPGANHNFYSIEWKQQITGELLRFLKGDIT